MIFNVCSEGSEPPQAKNEGSSELTIKCFSYRSIISLVLKIMKPFSQHRFHSFVKAPVVRLKKLIVREVATDRKAIFLVSPSSQIPEMYEIVCESAAEKKR